MKICIILAGGKGTRVLPLTDYVPKSLLPINGKPIMKTVINGLVKNGLSEFIVVLGYMSDSIKDFIKCNDDFGVKFNYHTYEGLRKGVASCLEDLGSVINEDFLLCASDTIFPSNYVKGLINYHEVNDCDATLSVSDLGLKEHLVGRSVVDLRADESIKRVIEKPGINEVFSTIVSTPMYTFNESLFNYLPRVTESVRGEYELQSAVQLMIDDGLKVNGCMNKQWNDLHNWKMIDDCYDFLRLNFKYLNLKPK